MEDAPTLEDYLRWLESVGGSFSVGNQADPDIGMVPAIRMTSPGGRRVIYTGSQEELLTASLIAYFDRRLDLLSPFVSGPPS